MKDIKPAMIEQIIRTLIMFDAKFKIIIEDQTYTNMDKAKTPKIRKRKPNQYPRFEVTKLIDEQCPEIFPFSSTFIDCKEYDPKVVYSSLNYKLKKKFGAGKFTLAIDDNLVWFKPVEEKETEIEF